jgi:hypothetical protein
MLCGRYDIRLNAKMPYPDKMVKIANEPVAFHLYKNRHFEQLKKTKGTFGPTDPLLMVIDSYKNIKKTAQT